MTDDQAECECWCHERGCDQAVPPCCDLHGRNCEPPSELCCHDCTEADHPAHRKLGPCSNPDLSANGVTDVQAVPPPAVTAIAAMLASRYSGQPTQRDLDVANVAAAAERERLVRKLRVILINAYVEPPGVLQQLADLLEGDTDE